MFRVLVIRVSVLAFSGFGLTVVESASGSYRWGVYFRECHDDVFWDRIGPVRS